MIIYRQPIPDMQLILFAKISTQNSVDQSKIENAGQAGRSSGVHPAPLSLGLGRPVPVASFGTVPSLQYRTQLADLQAKHGSTAARGARERCAATGEEVEGDLERAANVHRAARMADDELQTGPLQVHDVQRSCRHVRHPPDQC